MYDHVLIPTDGTDASRRAADHGISLAAALGATVTGLSVVEDVGSVQRDQLRADPQAEAEDDLATLEAAAEKANVPARSVILEGQPDREILGHVEEHDVDCIVMGTEQRTGLDRVLDHSVAEAVLEGTTVPVLTVQNPT